MSGEELSTLLKYHGVKISKLAAQLGKGVSTLQSRLAVKNVKPEFLKEIEEATGLDLSSYVQNNYEKKTTVSLSEILFTQMKIQEQLINNLKEQQAYFKMEAETIQKENKQIQKRIDEISRKKKLAAE